MMVLSDETKSKYSTDDFVLSGTISVRNFISPIKKLFEKNSDLNNVSRNVGILHSSTPVCKVPLASTPACSQKSNSEYGSNKENMAEKKKFDFLKYIDEGDEDEIEKENMELNGRKFQKVKSEEKIISVSILNNLSIRSDVLIEDEPLNIQLPDFNKLPEHEKTDLGSNDIGQEFKASQNYNLQLTQKIDNNLNLERFLGNANQKKKNIDSRDKYDSENSLENYKHHRSLPGKVDHKRLPTVHDQELKTKRKSMPTTKKKANRPSTEEPRRSKRVRLDKEAVGLYEFETIKDFQGNDLIVSKLVGVKSKRSASETPHESKDNKSMQNLRPSAHKKIESNSTDVFNHPEVKLDAPENLFEIYSFNRNINSKKFKRVSDGVSIHMINDQEDEGLLCIEPLMKCRTQRHTCDIFYVIRKGECSFLINGIETILKEAEVVKIPKNVKYKCGNVLTKENAYVHFHFL